jgi:hypothetical protein
LENVGKKVGDILAALAQGRNRNAKSSELVCELCRKAHRGNEGTEAAPCERNDTGRVCTVLAQKAKQCRLEDSRESLRMRDIDHTHGREGIFRVGAVETLHWFG